MRIVYVGTVEYNEAWELQKRIAAAITHHDYSDILLLLQHPPTITLGRSAHRENLLVSPETLQSQSTALVEVDRGGDITYHGPGQLVGYPILNLVHYRKDLHWYLRQIEEALILFLNEEGIEGRRFAPNTGVWVDNEKVAAIGIKVSQWITQHGFALNVNPELSRFQMIVPCGIGDYGVTTLEKLGSRLTIEDILAPVSRCFIKAITGEDATPVVERLSVPELSRELP